MADTVFCTSCGRQFKFGEQLRGRQVKCRGCGNVFTLPGSPPAAQVQTVPTAVRQPGPPPLVPARMPTRAPLPPAPGGFPLDQLADPRLASAGPPLAMAGSPLLPRSQWGGSRYGQSLSAADLNCIRTGGGMIGFGFLAMLLPLVGLQLRALRSAGEASAYIALVVTIIGAAAVLYGYRAQLVKGFSIAGGSMLMIVLLFALTAGGNDAVADAPADPNKKSFWANLFKDDAVANNNAPSPFTAPDMSVSFTSAADLNHPVIAQNQKLIELRKEQLAVLRSIQTAEQLQQQLPRLQTMDHQVVMLSNQNRGHHRGSKALADKSRSQQDELTRLDHELMTEILRLQGLAASAQHRAMMNGLMGGAPPGPGTMPGSGGVPVGGPPGGGAPAGVPPGFGPGGAPTNPGLPPPGGPGMGPGAVGPGLGGPRVGGPGMGGPGMGGPGMGGPGMGGSRVPRGGPRGAFGP